MEGCKKGDKLSNYRTDYSVRAWDSALPVPLLRDVKYWARRSGFSCSQRSKKLVELAGDHPEYKGKHTRARVLRPGLVGNEEETYQDWGSSFFR